MTNDYQPQWRIEAGGGRDLGIGIIGCGGIVSGAHLPAYQAAGLNVFAVFDLDQEKARSVASDFGIPTVAGSVEELASMPGVDIVDISVLPWAQPEVVEVVAAAGKPMLCQKPLAMDYSTGVHVVEVAEAAGVPLAVNHQMRWDAGIAASRDLVRQGALGVVTEAQIQVSVSTPLHLWAWIAEMPHLDIKVHSTHYLDALRSILGDPEWVTSIHGRYPGQAPVVGETVTKTVLEYADGHQALVATNHYNQHGEPSAEFRFLGTEGTLAGTIGLMYDYPNGRPDTLSLYRDGVEAQAFEFDTMWLPDAFLGPMSDLMDAIATGRPPATAGRQMLPTLAIGEAAYLSAEARRSVRLSETDRHLVMTESVGTPGFIFSMLQRAFGDAEMEVVFSETATVESWLMTEAALARAQASIGEMSADRAEAIAAACSLESIDLPSLWAETANVGYPVLPLVRQITERLPASERGSLHYGATTQDIMDTGLSLQLAAALERLEVLTTALGDALAQQVDTHTDTVMAGRTHGQQAVPTTFGAKLATYLRQSSRLRTDLAALRPMCCQVSLHGAAGTSAGFGPRAHDVRAEVGRQLGLTSPDGPWHVTRDGVATFGAVCARAASICARLAREVIDLSRTEIGEVSESAGHHRGASSTMPQKANPIDSESIVGMAASVTASSASLYRAMEAGHERSAGEWQVEWHSIPQVAVLSAGCLSIASRIVEGLQVHPDRMAANLDLEQGRTLAEAYMFELAPELGREAAHDVVYEAAVASKARQVELRETLSEVTDPMGTVPDISPADYTGQARDEAARAVADWRRV